MTEIDVSKEPYIKQADTQGLDTINIAKNEQVTNALEIAALTQYIDERAQRLKAKLVLREKNHNVDSLRLDENYLKKLDSSIKKVSVSIPRFSKVYSFKN